jgi:hypothetical protein
MGSSLFTNFDVWPCTLCFVRWYPFLRGTCLSIETFFLCEVFLH